MRYYTRRRRALAGAVVLACASCARASDISATWTGTAGSWTVPSNWSSNPKYPNNGSLTFDALINTIGVNVNLNAPITVNGFGLSAGTLSGSQTLTINGAGSWLGGDLSGTGTINIKSTLLIDGTDHGLSKFTINVGTTAVVNWNSHNIHNVDSEGGVLNNAGTFNDSSDNGWYWDSLQTPVFNNTGTFIRSGADGNVQDFWPAMNNSGTVNVQSGGLWLAGGGNHTGTFTVDSNAQLNFSDFNQLFGGGGTPTTTFASSAVVMSDGTIEFANNFGDATTEFSGKYDSQYTVIDAAGGRVRFAPGALLGYNIFGDLEVRSGTVAYDTQDMNPQLFANGTISGGALSGTDILYFDNLSWTGGTITSESPSAVIATTSLDISGPGVKTLASQNLYNGGSSTATVSGGEIDLSNSSIINSNDITGVGSFDIQDDVLFQNTDADNSASQFYNDGVLIKSGGTGSAVMNDIQMYNTGTVIVQSGTLRLAGGGDQTGTFIIDSGATLDLKASTAGAIPHTFEAGAFVLGSGGSTLRISGQTDFTAGSSMNVDHLLVQGQLTNTAATFTAVTTDIDSAGSLLIDAGTLNTSGAINVGNASDGAMGVYNGGRVTSLVGAVATAVGTGTVIIDSGAAPSLSPPPSTRWDLGSFLQIGAKGHGALTINGLNAVVSDTIGDMAVFDPSSTAVASVTNGGQWINSDILRVGNLGSATLSIGSGGKVTSLGGYVAGATGGHAVVTIDGVGSSWAMTSFLSIGNSGDGTVTVSNGGTLANFDGIIADVAGTHGTMTVSGNGSRWDSTGATTVGNSGNGTLLVQSGAQITTGTGGAMAASTGAVGVATITGSGSRWDMQRQLVVGLAGPASLTISNGAVVTSKSGPSVTVSAGIVGRFGAGIGTLLVTGDGSQYNMPDGALVVGFGQSTGTDSAGGSGFLSIANGGVISSLNGFVARFPTSTGTANVGGTGSAWNIPGGLAVGGDVAAPGGAGTLNINAGGTVAPILSTRVWNGGRINYNGGTFATGTLTLTGGGDVILSSGADKVLQTTAISTDSTFGSRLDLADNKAIIHYSGGTPITSIRQQIGAGYNNGLWNHDGITSASAAADHSKALGYGESTTLGISTFGGVSLTGNNVLIKYTWAGDANLDGIVDIKDITALALNYNTGGKLWTTGDFNYDGNVNVADLTLLAKNWQHGVGAPLGPSLEAVLTNLGLPDVSVPEPGALPVVLGVSMIFQRRRRRSQRRHAPAAGLCRSDSLFCTG